MFHSLFSWAMQLLDGSVPRWGSCPGRRFGIYRVVEATLTYSGFTRLFQGARGRLFYTDAGLGESTAGNALEDPAHAAHRPWIVEVRLVVPHPPELHLI